MALTKIYYSSILAGIFISIGCVIYTMVGGILGAFLFGFGLTAVLVFKASLYTGKAGYVRGNFQSIADLGVTVAGNLTGAVLVDILCSLAQYSLNQPSASLVISLFPKAILCGMMMYIMVEGIKNTEHPIRPILLLGVPLFILTGMSHSVATMFYLLHFNYGSFWTEIGILFVSLLGNFIGAKLVWGIQKLAEE